MPARRGPHPSEQALCGSASSKAGAFDTLQLNRAALVASIDRVRLCRRPAAMPTSTACLIWAVTMTMAPARRSPIWSKHCPGVKERLLQEKTALGFYLSGHLFDEVEREVRRFRQAAHRRDCLIAVNRKPWRASATSASSMVNRVDAVYFKLDDKSAAIGATVDEELLNAQRALLQDDAWWWSAASTNRPAAASRRASTLRKSGT